MKKLAPVTAAIAYLLSSGAAFAQTIRIQDPDVGYSNISDFINASIRLAFIIALIMVLAMLVWGAVEWIMSGGSKEGLDGARKRIINALIGLTILAVAFAVVNLAGNFLGIDLLGDFIIPSPDNSRPSIPTPTTRP